MAVGPGATIGWRAASLKSMIANRRWASPTERAGEIQAPFPSGPRWARRRSSTESDEANRGIGFPSVEAMPAMPHILPSRHRFGLSGDANRPVRNLIDEAIEPQ
jgi:hypothetical protein